MSTLSEGRLARVAGRFTGWAERWIPDAFVFALLATVIVVVAAFRVAAGPARARAARPR